MSELVHADFSVVDESIQFFAPVASDVISTLLGRYQSERVKVERIDSLVNSAEYSGAVQYFLSGNSSSDRSHTQSRVADMFHLKGAIFAMNARYWGEALALTDVYDCMPQARRDYWNAQLQGKTQLATTSRSSTADPIPPLPDFQEETVRNTLGDLLRQRTTFFAERVDGVFRGLSSSHVTNVPEGFSKRMIIEYMLSYGSIRHEKAGLINDLRCVIAKFMGRDEPKHNSSDVLIRNLYATTGQWVTIDGGALRIRVYKKGTAHLEVHADLAWRLNQVLSSLYPRAIPAEFRTKAKKQPKDFQMMGRPLPFVTLELLATGKVGGWDGKSANIFTFSYNAKEFKVARTDACVVLAALGGTANKSDGYDFDYPVEAVLREVIITGCLPDQKAHQYYPTPEKLASMAVHLAGIGADDTVLEPSAGQGGIADHLPKERTTCVEISPLHCAVLRAKGFATVEADFVAYADAYADMKFPHQPLFDFDVVVMNPPFSEGRAKLHTEYAASLVKPGGRLVAILPASLRNKNFLGAGWSMVWTESIDNAFPGVSVSVTILKAVKGHKAL